MCNGPQQLDCRHSDYQQNCRPVPIPAQNAHAFPFPFPLFMPCRGWTNGRIHKRMFNAHGINMRHYNSSYIACTCHFYPNKKKYHKKNNNKKIIKSNDDGSDDHFHGVNIVPAIYRIHSFYSI